MSKTLKIRKSSKADQFDAGNELWESRELGASPKHAVRVSDEHDKELDDAMGLQLLTFRLQKPLIEQLKQLAKLEGLGYQPLMRQILTRYVRENEHKLEQLLTPHQASEKAEQLFMQALKYKELISTMAPMTNERIGAECDYSTALGSANALFCQAYEKCADLVLKKYIKLRLDQIYSLLDEDSQEFQNKKYGKAV
jgi:hypothetical protein